MLRLVTLLSLVLMFASGCLQTSERLYKFGVDPKTGMWQADVAIRGADIKAQSIKLTSPNGFNLEVEGVAAQDQTAVYSAQLGMYQNQTTAQLLGTILPALLAKVGVGSGAPANISPPPALVIKPSILDQPTVTPAPTSQPATPK